MDIKKVRCYQIFSVIIAFILGSLLHFTYNFSNENSFIAIFSSINESVWEHLKLLFFPMILTTIIGSFHFGKEMPNFFCSKTLGIILSMLFLIIFFYTYTGIIGKNIALVDITSFFIAVILGEYTSYRLVISGFECKDNIAVFILIIITFFFIIFTFYTPNLGIFKDPVTGLYGLV